MLTWDEEVKPSSPKNLDSGLPHDRKAEPTLAHVSTAFNTSPIQAAAPAFREGSPLAAAAAKAAPLVSSQPAEKRRVNAADKRIINGQTDVNQLVPFKY